MSQQQIETVTLICVGTRQHPGCGARFVSATRHPRFCGDCDVLDKQSSYVFVARRAALRAAELQEED